MTRTASALLSFSLVAALGASASAQSRTPASQPAAERQAPAAQERAPVRPTPTDAPTCPDRVSVDEFVEALTESAERAGGDVPTREQLTECFQNLDSDGDGAVDTAERTAAWSDRRVLDPDTCVLTTNVCHL